MPTPNQPAQPETAPATAHTPTDAAMRVVRALCPQVAYGVDCGQFVPAMLTDRALTVDAETGLPALISERDRLRVALEEVHEWYANEAPNSEAWQRARAALANTTPSESARLRESNADVIGVFVSEAHYAIAALMGSANPTAAIQGLRAALKKAKDAQG